MSKLSHLFLALLLLCPFARPQARDLWRSATESELEGALPARAPVEKERIETEMRTASGIIDAQSRVIAGVVLITAGYSADGKYSHYLLVQHPIAIGSVDLPAGAYVLGWKRVPEGLLVHLYTASNGAERGTAVARQMPSPTRVEAFHIWPPSDRSIIQIGRFSVPYTLKP